MDFEYSSIASPTLAKHWGKQQMQITVETSSGHPGANTGAELPADAACV